MERRRVSDAQAYLSDVMDRPVSLLEVADAVGWSPWHLVRTFRRQVGVSPYRYHVRLRLRAAVGAMMQGRDELTAIALRAGFSSHSHFTQAFRREFGEPPRALVRSLRADG
jgi:transcriptional regulator GlxA family with amidase domain